MSNSVGGTQTSSASIFNSWRLSAKACLLQPLFLRGHGLFSGEYAKSGSKFRKLYRIHRQQQKVYVGDIVIPYVWIGIASMDKGSISTPKGLILAKKLQVGPVLLRDQ